jgi:hypothetical protein
MYFHQKHPVQGVEFKSKIYLGNQQWYKFLLQIKTSKEADKLNLLIKMPKKHITIVV